MTVNVISKEESIAVKITFLDHLCEVFIRGNSLKKKIMCYPLEVDHEDERKYKTAYLLNFRWQFRPH